MLDMITKFSACCKAAGLKVSPLEVIDCMSQLRHIDATDEAAFRSLLMANFIKSRRDQPRFLEIYHLFFHELRTSFQDAVEESDDPETPKQKRVKEIIEKIREELGENMEGLENLLDYLGGDPEDFLNEVQEIHNMVEQRSMAIKVKSNMGQLSNRLSVMLKINQIRQKALQLAGDLDAEGDTFTRREIEAYFATMLDRSFDLLTRDKRPDNIALKEVSRTDPRFFDIGEKPFATLTPVEMERTKEITDRLVRKLKDMATRRYAARNKGVLDVRKTLRRAGRFQGVPLELHFRDKPLRKGKIVALCDVSGSVWSVARFMLAILYSLQECFNGIKSYAFVSDVADITPLFKDNPVNEAIEKVFSESGIDTRMLTDYGSSFVSFRERHMQELSTKTTLLIIGDARSNYQNPHQEILEEMRDRCRRVIWLNPEPMTTWSSGDSEMFTYKAHCHEIRPCRNLNQLVTFIEELVL
ncbi:vWA domain-containing protein [Desulfobotulus mexicanus]|uniref:VWA domain-containing protein n=1 Tax=Desulfobotulus mexicanus TaxID=2586642 RepID=A0A5S5MDA8_9BACT|nr:VWA domain-containing protein [Desulfobotulus mexicanus]TYT73694.1 VWA domain-containing protein [Desulfobotulus mexicanus]